MDDIDGRGAAAFAAIVAAAAWIEAAENEAAKLTAEAERLAAIADQAQIAARTAEAAADKARSRAAWARRNTMAVITAAADNGIAVTTEGLAELVAETRRLSLGEIAARWSSTSAAARLSAIGATPPEALLCAIDAMSDMCRRARDTGPDTDT